MDFNGIKEVIDRVDNSSLSYFEYETKDGHLKMDKSLVRPINGEVVTKTSEPILNNDSPSYTEEPKPANIIVNSESKIEEDLSCKIITAPMVGTFYSSEGPDKPSFVAVGEEINKGKTLCIIEAMKLMNEIESDYNGTVKEILVKDGDMVEYGQPLFKIKES